MNKIYKVIWSKVKNQYVVVSELAHSNGKQSRTSRNSIRSRIAALVVCGAITAFGVYGALPNSVYAENNTKAWQYAAISTEANPDFGEYRDEYHLENVQVNGKSKTYWVRDGYHIDVEQVHRYDSDDTTNVSGTPTPMPVYDDVIRVYRNDDWEESNANGLLSSMKVSNSNMGITTLNGKDLQDITAGTFVGASSGGGTEVPSNYNYLINDNGKWVDAGNEKFKDYFKTVTYDNTLGGYTYNNQLVDPQNVYFIDGQAGVFLVSGVNGEKEVYKGAVYGAYNEILVTGKDSNGNYYSYWGAERTDPNETIGDKLTVGQYNNTISWLNDNIRDIHEDDIKQIQVKATDNGGTIGLQTNGEADSKGNPTGGKNIPGTITIKNPTIDSGTNGKDVKIQFGSIGEDGKTDVAKFTVDAGSKVEGLKDEATAKDGDTLTGLKINGVEYDLSQGKTYSPGQGIAISDDNKISVDKGDGLEFTSNADDAKLEVNANEDKGIIVNSSGVAVNAGEGLAFETEGTDKGKLKVNVGDGLSINGSNQIVNNLKVAKLDDPENKHDNGGNWTITDSKANITLTNTTLDEADSNNYNSDESNLIKGAKDTSYENTKYGRNYKVIDTDGNEVALNDIASADTLKTIDTTKIGNLEYDSITGTEISKNDSVTAAIGKLDNKVNGGWNAVVNGTKINVTPQGNKNTLEFAAGDHVSITPDKDNNKITIATDLSNLSADETNAVLYDETNKKSVTLGNGKNEYVTGTTGTGVKLTNVAYATGKDGSEEVNVDYLEDTVDSINNSAYKGWTVSANGETNKVVVPSNGNVDFSNTDGNIIVGQTGTNLTFDLNDNITLGDESGTRIQLNGNSQKDSMISITNKDSDTVFNIAKDGTVHSDGDIVAKADSNKKYSLSEVGENAVRYNNEDKSTVALAGTSGTTITNVADGALNEESTEAVNGSQLYAVDQKVNDGWTAKVGDDEINVRPNGENETGKDTLSFAGDDNITVTADAENNAINVKLNNNITLGQDKNQININGDPSKGEALVAIGSGENPKFMIGQNGEINANAGNTSFNFSSDGVAVNANGASTIIKGQSMIVGSDSNGEGGVVINNNGSGTINGLSNLEWDKDNIVSGQAATEDQLQDVATEAAKHTTVSGDENITVNHEEGSQNYQVTLDDTVYLGGNHTAENSNIKLDGEKGNIQVGSNIALLGEDGRAIIGGVDISTTFDDIGKKSATITGLSNTTWDTDKVVVDRAATEGQLQMVSDKVTAGWTATDDAGNKINVNPETRPTLNFASGKNITVSANEDSGEVEVSLNDNINLNNRVYINGDPEEGNNTIVDIKSSDTSKKESIFAVEDKGNGSISIGGIDITNENGPYLAVGDGKLKFYKDGGLSTGNATGTFSVRPDGDLEISGKNSSFDVDAETGNVNAINSSGSAIMMNDDSIALNASGNGVAISDEGILLNTNGIDEDIKLVTKGTSVSVDSDGATFTNTNTNETTNINGGTINVGDRLVVDQNGTTIAVNDGTVMGNNTTMTVNKDGVSFSTYENGTTVINGQTISAGGIVINGEDSGVYKGTITGLTNTTLDNETFAKVGRAATEEQLKQAAAASKTTLSNGINTNVTSTEEADGHVDYQVNLNKNINLNDRVYINGDPEEGNNTIVDIKSSDTSKKESIFAVEDKGNGSISIGGIDITNENGPYLAVGDGKLKFYKDGGLSTGNATGTFSVRPDGDLEISGKNSSFDVDAETGNVNAINSSGSAIMMNDDSVALNAGGNGVVASDEGITLNTNGSAVTVDRFNGATFTNTNTTESTNINGANITAGEGENQIKINGAPKADEPALSVGTDKFVVGQDGSLSVSDKFNVDAETGNVNATNSSGSAIMMNDDSVALNASGNGVVVSDEGITLNTNGSAVTVDRFNGATFTNTNTTESTNINGANITAGEGENQIKINGAPKADDPALSVGTDKFVVGQNGSLSVSDKFNVDAETGNINAVNSNGSAIMMNDNGVALNSEGNGVVVSGEGITLNTNGSAVTVDRFNGTTFTNTNTGETTNINGGTITTNTVKGLSNTTWDDALATQVANSEELQGTAATQGQLQQAVSAVATEAAKQHTTVSGDDNLTVKSSVNENGGTNYQVTLDDDITLGNPKAGNTEGERSFTINTTAPEGYVPDSYKEENSSGAEFIKENGGFMLFATDTQGHGIFGVTAKGSAWAKDFKTYTTDIYGNNTQYSLNDVGDAVAQMSSYYNKENGKSYTVFSRYLNEAEKDNPFATVDENATRDIPLALRDDGAVVVGATIKGDDFTDNGIRINAETETTYDGDGNEVTNNIATITGLENTEWKPPTPVATFAANDINTTSRAATEAQLDDLYSAVAAYDVNVDGTIDYSHIALAGAPYGASRAGNGTPTGGTSITNVAYASGNDGSEAVNVDYLNNAIKDAVKDGPVASNEKHLDTSKTYTPDKTTGTITINEVDGTGAVTGNQLVINDVASKAELDSLKTGVGDRNYNNVTDTTPIANGDSVTTAIGKLNNSIKGVTQDVINNSISGGHVDETGKVVLEKGEGENKSEVTTDIQLTDSEVSGVTLEKDTETGKNVLTITSTDKYDKNKTSSVTVSGLEIASTDDIKDVTGVASSEDLKDAYKDADKDGNATTEYITDSESMVEADVALDHAIQDVAGTSYANDMVLSNRIDSVEKRLGNVEERIDKVGAMAAAIANLRTMGFDPEAPTEIAIGVGQYKSETGIAIGVFHYPNQDFMLSASLSSSGDELMGGIGATWKLGRKSAAERAKDEEARHFEQAEEMKKLAQQEKVKAQAQRHAKLLAERQQASQKNA